MTPIPVPPGLNLPALRTRDLTPATAGGMMSPFLVISRFTMTGPVFPPHPHAGFSVATYILPESPVGFWNQDTLGTVNRIAPGSLHWTVAGAGLQHEETVERSGRDVLGFQIWIDHPDALRETAPRSLHVAGGEVPVRREPGLTRRVVLGRDGDAVSPIEPPVDVTLLDVQADPGAAWTESLPAGQHGFIWVLSGEVRVADVAVAEDRVIPIMDGTAIATARGARLLRFSGVPMTGAPVMGGPFVAGSPAQMQAFQAAYRAGRMGRLVPFDQAELDRVFDAG